VSPLDLLLAKDAIADVAKRYCRGIDRCDADLVRSAYHPDAFDDHGTFKGNAWEFAGYATAALRQRYRATMHAITNHSIDVDLAAGTATGEVYTLAYHLRREDGSDDGRDVIDAWWGRYLDRYECRDGDWRIAHRVCVHEWTAQVPVEQAMPIAAELFQQGSADRLGT
jgi:hypothetical protein